MCQNLWLFWHEWEMNTHGAESKPMFFPIVMDRVRDQHPAIRGKFRSQTSDNIDRWKSRGGKSQRGEEKWEDQRGERERKKMQVRKKVGKPRLTVFFQWFVVPEGRQVTSLKARVRSHVVRWAMKNCTPSPREAHFQVKCTKHTILGQLLEVEMSKKCTPLWGEAHFQVKCTKHTMFGHFLTLGYEKKVDAVVARSTFPSQKISKVLKLTSSDHFFKLSCRRSRRRCGAKHISKSKGIKHTTFSALLEVDRFKKVHAVLAGSTYPSQNVQNTPCTDQKVHTVVARSTFGSQNCQKLKVFLTFSQMQKKCTVTS